MFALLKKMCNQTSQFTTPFFRAEKTRNTQSGLTKNTILLVQDSCTLILFFFKEKYDIFLFFSQSH